MINGGSKGQCLPAIPHHYLKLITSRCGIRKILDTIASTINWSLIKVYYRNIILSSSRQTRPLLRSEPSEHDRLWLNSCLQSSEPINSNESSREISKISFATKDHFSGWNQNYEVLAATPTAARVTLFYNLLARQSVNIRFLNAPQWSSLLNRPLWISPCTGVTYCQRLAH